MASQSFIHRASLTDDVPIDHRWMLLQDPATWAAIGGVDTVTEIRRRGDDLAGFKFSATVVGKRYPGTADVSASAAPGQMTLGIKTSELTGTIDVLLGDHLHVTLLARSRSILSSMMFPMIAAAIGSGLPERVDAVARRMNEPLV